MALRWSTSRVLGAEPMINFNQLRVFYHTANCLSFTKAAEELFITQPAITAQARLFEDQLGLKLFKRKRRRVYLTDEGKVLPECARKIFQYEKELRNVVDEMRQLKRGILRLGTVKPHALHVMPFVIAKFHGIYTHIRNYLDGGSSLNMIYSLLDFKNELAIVSKVVDHLDVCFNSLSKLELVVILAPTTT
jgi:DNA-binding transcriptional LysR family regulator